MALEDLEPQQMQILDEKISPILREHFGSAVLVVPIRNKAGGEATCVRFVGHDSYAKGLLYDGHQLIFGGEDDE